MSIAVSLPRFEPHKLHEIHFMEWYAANKQKHDLRLRMGIREPLHAHLGRTVAMAREQGCSHILFTEDDHYNYPHNGLDHLLEQDLPVVGLFTVSRKYPFHSLAMRRKSGREDANLITKERDPKKGFMEAVVRMTEDEPVVQKVDLLSWAFTLVKMEVFDKMDEAGLDPFEVWGPVPNDSYFCQYCDDVGVEKHVSFAAFIAHGEVSSLHRRHFLMRSHMIEQSMKGNGVNGGVQLVPEGPDPEPVRGESPVAA